MSNKNSKETPYLWGKKFCHEPGMSGSHPIHYAWTNSTMCGVPMLGNNYAHQGKDVANCPECLAAWKEELNYRTKEDDAAIRTKNAESELTMSNIAKEFLRAIKSYHPDSVVEIQNENQFAVRCRCQKSHEHGCFNAKLVKSKLILDPYFDYLLPQP